MVGVFMGVVVDVVLIEVVVVEVVVVVDWL